VNAFIALAKTHAQNLQKSVTNNACEVSVSSAVTRSEGKSTADNDDEKDPLTLRDALRSKYAPEWKKAVLNEYETLLKRNTWTYVRRDKEVQKNIIDCKWVFKTKRDNTGKIEKRKARLVAKGFKQLEGIDYEETFAPVMKYKSFRLILHLMNEWGYNSNQLDQASAFVNAEMNETIYMKQPDLTGITAYTHDPAEYVVKLNYSLYGTKQAARNWNKAYDSLLKRLGFTQCKSDPCVYIKKSQTNKPIIYGIFVDDAISIYHPDDLKEWENLKSEIKATYQTTDKGEVKWMLGMEITRDRARGIVKISQAQYVKELLTRFVDENASPMDCPEDVNEKLTKNDCPKNENETIDETAYRNKVGALNYLVSTRFDIAHAVNEASRFMNNPGAKHAKAVDRILLYLKGKPDVPLIYKSTDNPKAYHLTINYNYELVPCLQKKIKLLTATLDLEMDKRQINELEIAENDVELCSVMQSVQHTINGYSDSNWAGDLDDRRSTTGVLIKVGNSIIAWRAKKQATVALSSTEAEYMAATETLKEMIWIKSMLTELTLQNIDKNNITGEIFCDNKSTIESIKNSTDNDRSKHIDIRHHFIRDEIQKSWLKIKWIDTDHQCADILTKGLGPQKFKNTLKLFPNEEKK
jgi:hypothetical protein